MRIPSLVIAALALCASTASAQIATSGQGVPNSSGSPRDPNWSFHCSSTVFLTACNADGQAFIPLDIPSPPWQPNNGTSTGPNWISAWVDASAGSSTRTGDNSPNYAYTFNTAVGSAGLYELTLGWDNQLVGVFQDGNLLYGPSTRSGFCRDADGVFPSSDFPNCVVHLNLNLANTDDLVIRITGDGTTDGIFAEFDNAGQPESVVPEPGSMGLLATGLVGLMGVGARRRRKH